MKLSKKTVVLSAILISAISFWFLKSPLYPLLKYRIAPDFPSNASKDINLEGLKERVNIIFDRYGIPHIEAKNLSDLMLANGYTQARYRSFQLDLLRRFAAGRLSELLGEQRALDSTTVDFDLAMRGWGFERKADIALEELPAKDRQILMAFSKGINQAFKHYTSVEHRVLGARPKPWSYKDTLMIGMLQAWSITQNWEQESLRLILSLELGEKSAKEIYPLEPPFGEGSLNKTQKKVKLPPSIAPEALDFLKSFSKAEVSQFNRSDKTSTMQSALGDLFQLRPAASNAWVVGKGLSDSGHPILQSDMHLTHSLPGLIFLQHLKMPGLNIVGGTMPGLPFLISGYNGKVAWGNTSAGGDVVDLILEKPDPHRADHTLNQSRACKIKREKAIIQIKDQEPKTFTIRSSCNGPFLNDMYPGIFGNRKNSPLVAIRYKTPNIEKSFGHLLAANSSSDVYKLRDSLMKIPGPIQNILAADKKGNIAFFSTGSIPKRESHRGLFPIPGWLKKYEWKEWLTPKEMPHAFNPKKGYYINANNLVFDPYKNLPVFHFDTAPDYRLKRIEQMIQKTKIKNQKSLQMIQLDHYLERASKLAPIILGDLADENLSKEEFANFNELKNWDFKCHVNSKACSIFMEVYKQSIYNGLRNRLSPSAINALLKQRYSPGVFDSWFANPNHIIWDNPETKKKEHRPKAMLLAFRAAIKELKNTYGKDSSKWRWGELHTHKPQHPFGSKAFLEFFNLKKIPLPGALDSVWKAHFNLADQENTFKSVAGPVYRFSIDLGSPEKALFSTDTGASGWPLSKHYGDQYELWKKGELLPIERDFTVLKKKFKESTLKLKPKP